MRRIILSAIITNQCAFATGIDETPDYINALATYAESKIIDDGGLEQIIKSCTAGQITNPFTREVARTSTDMLLAFKTLQEYIDNAELDADRVCGWAKKAQVERQNQHEEREETREDTGDAFKVQHSIISASRWRNFAITLNGSVCCWGSDSWQYRNIPLDLGARSIAAGSEHVCAISAEHFVRCWGSNNDGQVTIPENLNGVISISAGSDHTCAIKVDGLLVCWGRLYGVKNIMPLDLGVVTSVSSGTAHICAIKMDRSLACWGYNQWGQTDVPLGLGAVVSVSAGMSHTCAIKADQTLECWGHGAKTMVPLDLGLVRSVSAGNHTCVVKMDGTARCWGSNDDGQTDIPLDLGLVHSIAVSHHQTCAVKLDGTVRCWGDKYGLTNVPPGLCLLGFNCEGTKP